MVYGSVILFSTYSQTALTNAGTAPEDHAMHERLAHTAFAVCHLWNMPRCAQLFRKGAQRVHTKATKVYLDSRPPSFFCKARTCARNPQDSFSTW